jgi:hypothetical protein
MCAVCIVNNIYSRWHNIDLKLVRKKQCGEKVILRGVSNPNIWFEHDGLIRYREIEKTGAKVVRIVWQTLCSP